MQPRKHRKPKQQFSSSTFFKSATKSTLDLSNNASSPPVQTAKKRKIQEIEVDNQLHLSNEENDSDYHETDEKSENEEKCDQEPQFLQVNEISHSKKASRKKNNTKLDEDVDWEKELEVIYIFALD